MKNKKGFTLIGLLIVLFAMAAACLIASLFSPQVQYLIENKPIIPQLILLGIAVVGLIFVFGRRRH